MRNSGLLRIWYRRVVLVTGLLLSAVAAAQEGQAPPADTQKAAAKATPMNDAPTGEDGAAGGPDKASSDTGEAADESLVDLEMGKALFRGLCSGCHGGAGKGGKGPNLTDDRWLHGDTDADIERTIRNGVSGTTMKEMGKSLKEDQIRHIIGYVRSLARAPGDDNWKPYMTGDPKKGEELFFDKKGKANCGNCHTVGRRGGRIGPKFDRLVARRSPQYIMESILEPSKDIDPKYESVQVLTEDGIMIVGLRVNETNFSIQLREENGRFHSLMKRDLEASKTLETSLMPDNYSQELTVQQLHDLFAYLMTLE